MLEEYRKKLNLLENKRYIELTCMIAQNSLTEQIPQYRIEPVENGKEAYIIKIVEGEIFHEKPFVIIARQFTVYGVLTLCVYVLEPIVIIK